jgi:bifunctional non-homologous end joining protein LigD
LTGAVEVVNGVTLSHPDRVYWPREGITKRDLVDYYERVASFMLPCVAGRPVATVRCPGGLIELPESARNGSRRVEACFFYKHPPVDFPGPFQRIMIEESGGPAPYLVITEPGSLTALAQMGVLEIHVWGSTTPDIEHPDMVVFDLDPDPTISWPTLADGARLVRDVLQAAGLESFVKTTGGKGLHVVTPIKPVNDWEEVRRFCRGLAQTVAELAPDRFTVNMSKSKRAGKIYIDYVRNTRGATSIAPFSTRARDGAPVAVPVRWDELGRTRPGPFTMMTLPRRLSGLKADPWDGYARAAGAQALPAA